MKRSGNIHSGTTKRWNFWAAPQNVAKRNGHSIVYMQDAIHPLGSKTVMCESESGFKAFLAGFGFGFGFGFRPQKGEHSEVESGFEVTGSGFGFKKIEVDSDSSGFGFEVSGFGSGFRFEMSGFAHHWPKSTLKLLNRVNTAGKRFMKKLPCPTRLCVCTIFHLPVD